MPIPSEITPRARLRVFDLVREAGVDVSDWKNFAKGVAHEASNPKYCYEWSFLQPGRVVVLKLWHDKLIENNGHVEQHLNLIADANKEPTGSRAKRREHMRQAIDTAIDEKLPIRVIVMKAGSSRVTKAGKKTRTVDHQILDPLPWAVVSREAHGCLVLRRGAPTAPYVDQYDLAEHADATPKKKDVPAGSIFVRDPSVRRRVLAMAMGLCELCKQPGFQLRSGSVYLETHHVIPLSEGGPDNVSNVVAICPNDHREAHHGKMATNIRARLLDVIGKRRSEGS
jgi:5-methylcytosine-specific restriction protein A